jgi:hypothetical protein
MEKRTVEGKKRNGDRKRGKEGVKQHQTSANKQIKVPSQLRKANRQKKILVSTTWLHGQGRV